MSTSIDRISLLLEHLPKKDINLGHKFLKERNFESLSELVNSAVYKVRKSIGEDVIKEDYQHIDIVELTILKSEVDIYCAHLEISSNYPKEEEEIEEEETYY